LKILEESSIQLGELKEQVSHLVKFFSTLLGVVNASMDEDVENFLRPIQAIVVVSAVADQNTINKLRDASKKVRRQIRFSGHFRVV